MPDVWNGDRIKQKVGKAAEFGVNVVMAACVARFKNNHPGWKNVSSTAEGSVRIQGFAKRIVKGTEGKWGSVGVDYMIWLEINHGSALRNAADVEYPKLAARIKRAI